MKPIKLDAEAEDELSAAYAWYEAQVRGLGDELLMIVDDQFARIQSAPRRFGLTPEVPANLNVRRTLIRRFPFSVFFVELEKEIRVLAVAHQSRRPGYWRKRVRRHARH